MHRTALFETNVEILSKEIRSALALGRGVSNADSEVPNRGRHGDPAAGDASALVGIVELSGP